MRLLSQKRRSCISFTPILTPISLRLPSASIRRLVQRLVTVFVAALFCIAGSPIQSYGMTTAPSDTVRAFYEELLNTMQNAQALGPAGRYARLEPVIHRTFDLPYMTRLAIGSSWAGLPDAKRQAVTKAFGRYITATYVDRFDDYSGEQFRVGGEETSSQGALVLSQIVTSDGERISINYLMHQSGGSWQITDVYLSGTISELAGRRAAFSSILRRQGIDALIRTLNNKADSLAAGLAGS